MCPLSNTYELLEMIQNQMSTRIEPYLIKGNSIHITIHDTLTNSVTEDDEYAIFILNFN